MKKLIFFMVAFALMMISLMATAQTVALPTSIPENADFLSSLQLLLGNYKDLGGVGIGMVVVMLIVQLAKSDLLANWYKNLASKYQVAFVTITGLVYGLLYTVFYVKSGWSVWIIGFISSGGAVSLFNLIKLLTEKEATA